MGEIAVLKAEGVPERKETDVKADDTLISPKEPLPDRSEELNGMEEKDEESHEFWKKEEEEQKRQNEEEIEEGDEEADNG